MTKLTKENHYYVAFERFQLFLAFCSGKGLKSVQTTLIRKPGSSREIPVGSTIYILDKPNQDTQVELDVAVHGHQCVLNFVNPFDRPVKEERRHG